MPPKLPEDPVTFEDLVKANLNLQLQSTVPAKSSMEREAVTANNSRDDYFEKSLLALEMERKAAVYLAQSKQRQRIQKHLSKLHEKAERELEERMQKLSKERLKEEEELEEIGRRHDTSKPSSFIKDMELHNQRQQELLSQEVRKINVLSKARNALQDFKDVESESIKDLGQSEVARLGVDASKVEGLIAQLSTANSAEIHPLTVEIEGQIDTLIRATQSLNSTRETALKEREKAAQQEALRVAEQKAKEAEVKAKEAELKAKEDLARQQQQIEQKRQEEAAKAAQDIAAKAAQESTTPQADQPQVSDRNNQLFNDLKAQRLQVWNAVKGIEAEKSQIRFLCQKVITTAVNAIGPCSSVHLKDKFDKLSKLLNGEAVQVGENQSVSASNHPLMMDYCKHSLAKKFVAQGAIAPKAETTFSMSVVVVALWAKFPDFGQLFLSHLLESCPYLIPMLPPNPLNATKEQYLALGYKYEDDKVEEQIKFINRMSGMTRMYASCCVSSLPKGQESVNHPHGLGNIWRWLSSTLNLKPMNDITATLVYDVLEIAGSALFEKYGKQFQKLLVVLCQSFFPQIHAVTLDGSGGPVMRLETFLKKAVETGSIKPPAAAALKPGFF